MGEAAAWQLRDAYLDTTGRTPPREWTWKRTARELFTEFDRLRLERVYRIYEEAKAAFEKGDLEKMRAGYDKVLALLPHFDRGEEMVVGYRKFAESVREEAPDQAVLALRRALRIDPDEKSRKETESELILLEARALRDEGVIDKALLDRAQELDPNRRSDALEIATPGEGITPWGAGSRYLVAGAVSIIALLGAAWVAVSTVRRRGKEQPNQETKKGPA